MIKRWLKPWTIGCGIIELESVYLNMDKEKSVTTVENVAWLLFNTIQFYFMCLFTTLILPGNQSTGSDWRKAMRQCNSYL